MTRWRRGTARTGGRCACVFAASYEARSRHRTPHRAHQVRPALAGGRLAGRPPAGECDRQSLSPSVACTAAEVILWGPSVLRQVAEASGRRLASVNKREMPQHASEHGVPLPAISMTLPAVIPRRWGIRPCVICCKLSFAASPERHGQRVGQL